jgi:hypothetical protein
MPAEPAITSICKISFANRSLEFRQLFREPQVLCQPCGDVARRVQGKVPQGLRSFPRNHPRTGNHGRQQLVPAVQAAEGKPPAYFRPLREFNSEGEWRASRVPLGRYHQAHEIVQNRSLAQKIVRLVAGERYRSCLSSTGTRVVVSARSIRGRERYWHCATSSAGGWCAREKAGSQPRPYIGATTPATGSHDQAAAPQVCAASQATDKWNSRRRSARR